MVNGGGAMVRQRKLIGVLGLGPIVHGFSNGESPEREERMGNSQKSKNKRRSYDSGWLGIVDGGAWSKRLRARCEGEFLLRGSGSAVYL